MVVTVLSCFSCVQNKLLSSSHLLQIISVKVFSKCWPHTSSDRILERYRIFYSLFYIYIKEIWRNLSRTFDQFPRANWRGFVNPHIKSSAEVQRRNVIHIPFMLRMRPTSSRVSSSQIFQYWRWNVILRRTFIILSGLRIVFIVRRAFFKLRGIFSTFFLVCLISHIKLFLRWL